MFGAFSSKTEGVRFLFNVIIFLAGDAVERDAEKIGVGVGSCVEWSLADWSKCDVCGSRASGGGLGGVDGRARLGREGRWSGRV